MHNSFSKKYWLVVLFAAHNLITYTSYASEKGKWVIHHDYASVVHEYTPLPKDLSQIVAAYHSTSRFEHMRSCKRLWYLRKIFKSYDHTMVGYDHHNIYFVDTFNGELKAKYCASEFTWSSRFIVYAAYLPKTKRMALTFEFLDNEIVLCDEMTWSSSKHQTQWPRILKSHTKSVDLLEPSADETMLASSSLDKTVCVWNLNSGTLLHTFAGSITHPCISWNDDGTSLFIRKDGDTLYRLHVNGWYTTILEFPDIVRFKAYPQQKNSMLVTAKNRLFLYDFITQHKELIFEATEGSENTAMRVSPSGTFVGIVYKTQSDATYHLYLLEMATHALATHVSTANKIASIAFASDDTFAVVVESPPDSLTGYSLELFSLKT